MTSGFEVISAGPAVSVQDLGRPGWRAQGLPIGGAMDRIALVEGAALLNQDMGCAAIEMMGFGLTLRAHQAVTIALTGAPMRATCDGAALDWGASHAVAQGQTLTIGAMVAGQVGYLHVKGGIQTPPVLDSRATHESAGLGRRLAPGDHLPLIADATGRAGLMLPGQDRWSGGTVRVLPTAQTALFGPDALNRLTAATFTRDLRGNRQGLRLDAPPEGRFGSEGQLTILSEAAMIGDIQVTGDGTPFVLMPEAQTTGGYPRLACVLPDDLPLMAQAPAGAPLRFEVLTLEAARAAHRPLPTRLAGLRGKVAPRLRDPADLPDLLSYDLVSGMVNATQPEIE